MRRTKIIATIGPKTESLTDLRELAERGVNVFRLNFSHGTHKWHGTVIDRIKKLNTKLVQPCAIMLDTKGPEIRTGDLRVPVKLTKGKELVLTIDHNADYEKDGKVTVNYDAFVDDVEVGDKILVDNGLMTLQVLRKRKTDVHCKILDGGELGSRRHLNLPGKDVSLDALTDKDWADIKFGIKKGVDFIALSFVRSPKEVLVVKKFLAKEKANISVIAKIETLAATKCLEEIFAVTDGIMVARGDLGAEIPFTKVPLIQWDIAQMAAKFHKPTIVATQMLESMQNSPMPTRAEVSDVFAATWQRNDAVMLSGETAKGEFPLKAVDAMREIVLETENNYLKKRPIRKMEPDCARSEFCRNAGNAAEDLKDVVAIVVITKSGRMASLMSSCRPQVPIFAIVEDGEIGRKLQLYWGVRSLQIQFSKDPEKTIKSAIKEIHEQKKCSRKKGVIPDLKGKKFVLLSDILVGKKFEPALQIREF